MKDYKYRYLYYVILTNKKSSHYRWVYFGIHKTNDLNDGYIGSGVLLKKYLKKYPNDYERYIVEYFDNDEDMFKAEYDTIHDVLGQVGILNLCEGGKGGDPGKEAREKIGKANKISLKGHIPWNKGKKGVQTAWNKGLKKETDQRMKSISESHKDKHKVWDNKELNKFHYEK